jgi:Ca-activated chloride channel family protein
MIRALNADELKDLAGDREDAGFGAIETLQGCLPLTALDVDVHIEGLSARTTVRQQFRNVFRDPLEATYIFPLPPRAAVTGFRMTVNDSVIEGRIDERGKAREDYDTAMAEGRTASIAEQERPDVFTLRVGNIPPSTTAQVELTLVAPLAIDSLEATYRFPLVVAPRYCPGVPIDGEQVGDGVAADTNRVPDASRISPPVLLPGFKTPVRLGIRVRIANEAMVAAQGSASLRCTLAATEVRDADGTLMVSVEPEQRLDRDFILRWGIAADSITTTSLLVEPDAARSTGLGTGQSAEEAPGGGTFSLVIVPPVQSGDIPQAPRDVVFMLDRSGSMAGWKIVAARRAIARMIDTLTSADRVAVLAFDNSVEHLGDKPQLVDATDRHRWAALEWLGRIDSRGGTELAAALEAGFDLFEEPNTRGRSGVVSSRRDRVFVLVTDGQVGDEGQVIANLVERIGEVALFVVGIDTAVNDGLLTRMAESTGGTVEMVESEDRLDDVMERIHLRLASPLLTCLSLKPAGLDIIPESLVPAKLPNLILGVPLVVWGRYRGAAEGGVCVEGRRTTGDTWQDHVTARSVGTDCQSSLWARGRLRHLEDLHETHRLNDVDALESRIVELSTAFGVLCRFTALTAIDPRVPEGKIDQASVRRIVQPVEQVAGMVGVRRHARFAPAPACFHFSGAFKEEQADLFSHMLSSTPSSMPHRWHRIWKILAKARPKSQSIDDMKPAAVRALLKAVLALLRELGEENAPLDTIDSLATAHGRLHAMPSNTDAIRVMLETLADLAGIPKSARWWHWPKVQSRR